MEVKNKSLLPVPSNRRSRKKGHPRGWRDRVTSGSPANRKLALGRKVGIPDRWFSRGLVECTFGQVMLIFVVLATLCFKSRANVFTRRLKAKLLPWPFQASFGQIMVQLTSLLSIGKSRPLRYERKTTRTKFFGALITLSIR
jgi:hypothetical protein